MARRNKEAFFISIEHRWCKGCYICLEVCPKKVFALTDTVDRRGFRRIEAAQAEQCTGCILCEIMCPDLAIRVDKKDKEADEKDG